MIQKKGKSDFLIKKDKTKNKNWKETFKKLDFPFFILKKIQLKFECIIGNIPRKVVFSIKNTFLVLLLYCIIQFKTIYILKKRFVLIFLIIKQWIWFFKLIIWIIKFKLLQKIHHLITYSNSILFKKWSKWRILK